MADLQFVLFEILTCFKFSPLIFTRRSFNEGEYQGVDSCRGFLFGVTFCHSVIDTESVFENRVSSIKYQVRLALPLAAGVD